MTNSYKCINKWYTTTTNTTTIDSWPEQVATRTLRIRLLCSSIFGKSTCRKNPRKRYSLRFRRKMSPLLHSFLYLALSSSFSIFCYQNIYISFFLFILSIWIISFSLFEDPFVLYKHIREGKKEEIASKTG